jgi:hypothetical protein
MRRILAALLLFLAAEGAASACSCVATRDPQELRRLAKDGARNALALVEVDVISGYDALRRRGERLRVRRTLAGRVPASIEVERPHPPSSASCALELQKGQRTFLILYPPTVQRWLGGRRHRVSGLCTANLLSQPVFRAELVEAIGRRRR